MSVSLFSTVGFEPVTLKGSVFSVLIVFWGRGEVGLGLLLFPLFFFFFFNIKLKMSVLRFNEVSGL